MSRPPAKNVVPAPADSQQSEAHAQEEEPEQPGPSQSPPSWVRTGAAWSWRFVAISAALYVLIEVGIALWVALLPVVLGCVIASLLSPVAEWLHRLRVPRPLASALAIGLGLSVIAATGLVIGLGVAREMDQLTSSLEEGYRQIVTWTAETLGVPPADVREFIDGHMEKLRTSAGSMAKQVVNRVPRAMQGLTVAVLSFVFSWFFAWDGDQQFERVVALLPPRRRHHARALGERVWKTVGGYMRGMVVVATADAILLGVGFWIIGLPLVLPLAMLMFVSAFVPFVGPVLTGSVACFVALGSGSVGQAGLVVLVSLVVQQLEGNLLQPFVMGRAVQLHPTMVLFAITAGGTLGGIVGVFLAIPAVASLSSVFAYMREQQGGIDLEA